MIKTIIAAKIWLLRERMVLVGDFSSAVFDLVPVDKIVDSPKTKTEAINEK